MGWQHTLYVYPILFGTVISLFIGAYTLRELRQRGRDPVLVTFLAVNAALVLWTGFSAVKLLSTDPATKLLFYRLLYLGVAPIGPLVLLFALAYTDRIRWVRPSVAAVLLFLPTVYLVVLWTNPSDLVIEGTRLVDIDGIVVMRVDSGFVHFLLAFVYPSVLSLTSAGITVYEAIRLGRTYVPQAVLMVLGAIAPILVGGLTAAGIPPFEPDMVNLIPASAVLTSTAFAVAVFRYRWLDLPPIAYTTAIRESPDGVLVLDSNGRVVHTNRRGEALLERWAGTDAFEELLDVITVETPERETVVVEDGANVVLGARAQPLARAGRNVGWVVVLRDVTERHRRQRQLEAQTERLDEFAGIVSHDLRNPSWSPWVDSSSSRPSVAATNTSTP